MNTYRCQEGHNTTIDFGEEMKKPCPTCGIEVYKFRDHAANEDGAEINVPQHSDATAKIKLGRNQKIGIGVAVAAMIVCGTVISNNNQKPQENVSTAAVLPIGSSAKTTDNKSFANKIADVAITDFKATLVEKDEVKLAFVLSNQNAANNDYPQLNVHWKDSVAPDTAIDRAGYAHPNAKFTRVAVETLLQRPADATGVELSIKY